MDKKQSFKIVITSVAERAYFDLLNYIFEHYAIVRANEIAIELIDFPQILKLQPYIGAIEPLLLNRNEEYRYLVYNRTNLETVKIIYYVDDLTKTVYITDFFPCEMAPSKVNK